MALPAFIAGIDGKVTYGVTPVTMAVNKWTAKASGGLLDRPSTTDGRRRIPGLPDLEGTISITVDTSATAETDLAPGVIVVLNLFTSSAKKIGPINAIIDSFDPSNDVEGSYDAEIAWKWQVGKVLP